jgi:Protein of unknown function (DUF1203)
VRQTRRAPDYGHPAHHDIATSGAPCRVCLEKFKPGSEPRLLFTYDPFWAVEPELPLPGPLYVHASPCRPFVGRALPPSIAGDRLTLTAYGAGRILLDEGRTAGAADTQQTISRLFADPRTQYVHVRSTPNGCFLCQLDRIRSGEEDRHGQ